MASAGGVGQRIGPSDTEVRGIGVCGWCDSQSFRIWFYADGHWRIKCTDCDETWKAFGQQEGGDVGGDEAVGEGGVVGADLGSAQACGARGEVRRGRLTAKAERPWEAAGVSRRTWYRR